MIPRRFFWLFDLIIIFTAFLVAYLIVPLIQPFFSSSGLLSIPWLQKVFIPAPWDGKLPRQGDLIWIYFIIAPTAIIVLTATKNYEVLFDLSRVRIIVGSILSTLAGLSIITLILYAIKSPDWSRLFVFSFTFLSGCGLAVFRLIFRQTLILRHQDGYYAKNVLIIGKTAPVNWMIRYFNENIPQIRYQLYGYLRLTEDQESTTELVRDQKSRCADCNLTLLGNVKQLGDLIIQHPIHEVIAILPDSETDWARQVIHDCEYFDITLRLVPQTLLLEDHRWLQKIYPKEHLHLPMVMLKSQRLNEEALFFKRLLDIFVSFVLLFFLVPIFFLIAIAIKLTTPRLPIFYPWRVVGYKGRRFTGYKFTTMISDADDKKKDLLAHNEMTGPVFKMKDDPRVTPLGRFLRKYSLNELPQLWSVFKGDMSLVGPRPAFPSELERYEFWQKRKLSVQPGITCLWQVRGRNKISNFDDWVRMDLEYINNWSIWLDLSILLRTAWVVVAGTGS